LQASCAAAGAESGQCAACGSAVEANSFHQLATSDNVSSVARRLGLESSDTIMKCASTALSLLAYQEQLVSAKKRQNDKAQLKKVTKQSQDKMRELHSATRKV
jgi:hypothetical protein